MNKQKTFFVIMYFALFVVTLIVAIIMFWEYLYFKHEAQELTQVKEAYYQHVDMLKRSLNASMVSSEEDEQELDSEKKKITENGSRSDRYALDYSMNVQVQEPKIDFQVISDDEEHRLKQIKSCLQPKQSSVVKRQKKVSRKAISRVVRSSARYAPQRDFVFLWPIDLQNFWLSSLFGPRKRPNGHVEFHHAIDMAAMKGTPVKAAASGKIIIATTLPGFGNCIMIEHNHCYKTRYAHLHRIGVRVGQVVQAGQQIGSVGDTGLVRKSGRDASHLHFEVHQNGSRVNPLAFLFS